MPQTFASDFGRTQDRFERAVHARMLSGETFIDAVEAAEDDDHLFEIAFLTDGVATVTDSHGSAYTITREWLDRRNYPR